MCQDSHDKNEGISYAQRYKYQGVGEGEDEDEAVG